jgi:diguanylate cyclase (GGDEF)-like protein
LQKISAMQNRLDRNLKWMAAAIIAIVGCLASLPYMSSREADGTMETLKAVAERERSYNQLLGLLKDAETGQRGYVITGDRDFLDPYEGARAELPGVLDHLAETADTPAEQALVRDVTNLADRKMAELARTVHMRDGEGFAPTAAIVTNGEGKAYMDDLRHLIGTRIATLGTRRAALRGKLEQDLDRNTALAIAASLVSTLIVCVALYVGGRSLRQRAQAVEHARQLGAAQAAHALETQLRNQRLTVSAQMLQAMDSLNVTTELAGVLRAFLPRLLPDTLGAIYLYRNSRDYLERCAVWGDGGEHAELMTPTQCWSLRLGAVHQAAGADALHCPHCRHAEVAHVQQWCVPMVSQGEVIGLLVVAAPVDAQPQLEQAFVVTVAEQLGLGISNIHLREVLRRQSTVDELTGLYNRRYFDEACRHELFRAERKKTPFALVMVDLDHFKRMNDTYGHDAGDQVLREAAHRVQDGVRRSDIACRYGGEELVLLLPECDAQAAAKCAEGIRRALAAMTLSYRDLALPAVTASFGVAAWPEHGDSMEALLQAADAALYTSKNAGRNRVTIA